MATAPTKATKEFLVHPYVQFMQDKYDAYRTWLKSEGLPILDGSYVYDARTVELADWERRGGRGAYLRFSDQMVADAYIAEIPPGGSLKPQHQMFEEIILVAAGQGATSIWQGDSPRRTFEWQRGSLFAIPLNASHEHHNASGSEPARFISLTSAPISFELFRDADFIFNTDHVFKDRFDPWEDDFFTKPGQYLTEYYGGVLHTNFIADVRQIQLVPRDKRGKGTRNMYIHLAGSTMFAHISQFPVGRYKKAHRHGPGAHVCMIDSSGYTLMWDEGAEPEKYDWAEGSIICPPAGTWHQHYNTGPEPCRFVALHASTAVAREEGGIEQIDFENEERKLRSLYEAECAKNGVTVQMDD
jgi:mannose-6-phosphate isomerase-like protein (cupin superfamily)